GSGWGVFAQRFDSTGAQVGSEFQVNTTTASDQFHSTVAVDGMGAFVITWTSQNQDGSGYGVYGQRYDASGAPLGGEFLINTTTASDQAYSSVAMDGAGNFVVSWTSFDQDAAGTNGVYAQRFDASGVAQGTEFRLNSTVGGDQQYSSVAQGA